ncbi:unnamed protein product [Lymnaea stagnalis]|uniref:Uncharacterized protein n=1 Tax=Lymnaea stagnalis TaxID=6523 RepID=A0AAV2IAG7_LYMST
MTSCASLSNGVTADQVCDSERSRMVTASSLTSACKFLVPYTTCMNSHCTAREDLKGALGDLKNNCDGMSPVGTSSNPPTTTVEMNSNETTGGVTTAPGAGVSLTQSLAIRSLTLVSFCTSLALVLK